jgi:hypothetical protein
VLDSLTGVVLRTPGLKLHSSAKGTSIIASRRMILTRSQWFIRATSDPKLISSVEEALATNQLMPVSLHTYVFIIRRLILLQASSVSERAHEFMLSHLKAYRRRNACRYVCLPPYDLRPADLEFRPAAVCGSVFASPNASQIRKAIELVDSDKGCALIFSASPMPTNVECKHDPCRQVGVPSLAVAECSHTRRNYTGDVLNFGLAKERYTAENPSSDKLRMVIVGDDVAVGKTQSAIVGRRCASYLIR